LELVEGAHLLVAGIIRVDLPISSVISSNSCRMIVDVRRMARHLVDAERQTRESVFRSLH
jgi:hypothetical protein